LPSGWTVSFEVTAKFGDGKRRLLSGLWQLIEFQLVAQQVQLDVTRNKRRWSVRRLLESERARSSFHATGRKTARAMLNAA